MTMTITILFLMMIYVIIITVIAFCYGFLRLFLEVNLLCLSVGSAMARIKTRLLSHPVLIFCFIVGNKSGKRDKIGGKVDIHKQKLINLKFVVTTIIGWKETQLFYAEKNMLKIKESFYKYLSQYVSRNIIQFELVESYISNTMYLTKMLTCKKIPVGQNDSLII